MAMLYRTSILYDGVRPYRPKPTIWPYNVTLQCYLPGAALAFAAGRTGHAPGAPTGPAS